MRRIFCLIKKNYITLEDQIIPLYKYYPITELQCGIKKIKGQRNPFIIFDPQKELRPTKNLKVTKKWKEIALNGRVFLTSPIYFNDPFDSLLPENIEPKPTKSQRNSFLVKLKSACIKNYNFIIPDETYYKLTTSDNFEKELINLYNDINKNFPIDVRDYKMLLTHIRFSIIMYRDEFSITCFTEKNNNELMWYLYAGDYNGFCIEYDFTYLDKFLLRDFAKVNYTNKIISSPLVGNHVYPKAIMLNKRKIWKNEHEWRYIKVNKYNEINNNLYGHLDLSRFITKIYLGYKMNEYNKHLIIDHYKDTNIKVLDMVIDKKNLKLNFEEV